ncbi:substrate-binding domain-containing protein [Neobacillus cucumis]|uniref:LacI family transcriptional regulator n=1 Tax=Neobacillus cucumis TaxID=1740721 RepID=A0A2N5HTQ7_9BACI|nr:substrate-binding domain-containing protein [Neobacillus cucumis]PLS08904.1 LacI family transcriptional regulator [Neobacillus cucumis]
MKKLIVVYIFLLGLFALYLFYYKSTSLNETALEKAQEGIRGNMNEKYVMVTFQAGHDYWKRALKGFEDAAGALNVSIEYRGAAQYDVHEQITVLEQVIAKKPDGIAISAIDPDKLTTTINKAIDAGIPVVLFDSGAPSSKAQTFIGTDNYNAGVMGAQEMASLLDNKGQVGIVTLPNQLNHQERVKGFLETMEKDYPGIKVVEVKDGKGSEPISRMAAKELLSKYPHLNGIFATEAIGGIGVGSAVSAVKGKNKVKIVSFDTDKPTLDLIKDGTISATLAQGTWKMGYWSMQFLFHLNHKLTADSKLGNISAPPLPPNVDTGVSVITKKNVGDFYGQ